jgi:hypothetical protein
MIAIARLSGSNAQLPVLTLLFSIHGSHFPAFSVWKKVLNKTAWFLHSFPSKFSFRFNLLIFFGEKLQLARLRCPSGFSQEEPDKQFPGWYCEWMLRSLLKGMRLASTVFLRLTFRASPRDQGGMPRFGR